MEETEKLFVNGNSDSSHNQTPTVRSGGGMTDTAAEKSMLDVRDMGYSSTPDVTASGGGGKDVDGEPNEDKPQVYCTVHSRPRRALRDSVILEP